MCIKYIFYPWQSGVIHNSVKWFTSQLDTHGTDENIQFPELYKCKRHATFNLYYFGKPFAKIAKEGEKWMKKKKKR